MFGKSTAGPREGDRVQVETLGRVVSFEERSGTDGALVELDGNGDVAWVPLKFLTSIGLR
jgi:hypothetical protein